MSFSLIEHCDNCTGHGYAAFHTGRDPWVELQVTDDCDCLARRRGLARKAIDDDIREVFLSDLRARDEIAWSWAFEIMPRSRILAWLQESDGMISKRARPELPIELRD